MTVLQLSNPVRSYPWGSTSAIPDLLGIPPDGEPKAELWMGAHPDSPSTAPDGSPLDRLIDSDPIRLLGAAVLDVFGRRLPYLLKVLAAAAPLSLQVHPGSDQAAAGFADEEARGVPREAAERRYRDPFHKPEMLVALGPFEALCGLRDPSATLALLHLLDVEHPAWPDLLQRLSTADPRRALRECISWLLDGDGWLPTLVDVVGRAAGARADRPEFATVAALSQAYPGDSGVLVALLLNRVSLLAGEALSLPAGNLHAYLEGTGVEVMAASDNVLRAGLTSKHVDADEVLRLADFTPRPIPLVVPERRGTLSVYRPGAAEFELALVNLPDPSPIEPTQRWQELPLDGPRILLVLSGDLHVAVSGNPLSGCAPWAGPVGRGVAIFVPAGAGTLLVRGLGGAVVAGVPGGSG